MRIECSVRSLAFAVIAAWLGGQAASVAAQATPAQPAPAAAAPAPAPGKRAAAKSAAPATPPPAAASAAPPPAAAPAAPPPAAAPAAPPPAAAPAPALAQPGAPVQAAPPPTDAPQTAPPPSYAAQPAPGYYDYRAERGYRRPRRSHGFFIAGIAVFGASYAVPAIIGLAVASVKNCTHCGEGAKFAIPVGGPLLFLDKDNAPAANALLVIDSVAQVAGIAMLVLGIIRMSSSDDDDMTRREPKLSLSAAPLPGGAYAGLKLRL